MAQSNSQHCVSELIILFRQNLNPPIYTHCTTYDIQHTTYNMPYKCKLCKHNYGTKKSRDSCYVMCLREKEKAIERIKKQANASMSEWLKKIEEVEKMTAEEKHQYLLKTDRIYYLCDAASNYF